MHKDLGPINITTKSKLKTKKLKRWKKSTYNKKVSQSYRGKYNSVWSLWQQNLKVIIGQVSSNRIIHLNQTRKIVWGIRGNKGDAVIAHAKEIVAQCKWKVVERNGGTIRWCRDVKISKLVWLKWGTKSAECLAGRLQPWQSSGLLCWEPRVSGQWIWNFIWKLLKVIQIEFIWGGIICCHGWKGVAGGEVGTPKRGCCFLAPSDLLLGGGVCLSCVSNAPLHNFCNSWFVNFALGLLAGVVLIAISVAVAIAPYTQVWGFPRVSSIPGVSVFFSCVGALAPPAVKMPCKFVRQHVQ